MREGRKVCLLPNSGVRQGKAGQIRESPTLSPTLSELPGIQTAMVKQKGRVFNPRDMVDNRGKERLSTVLVLEVTVVPRKESCSPSSRGLLHVKPAGYPSHILALLRVSLNWPDCP